jgi:hypothetical protein
MIKSIEAPERYTVVFHCLVWDLQKEVIKTAHWIPGLWWTRIEVRCSRIKNYEPHHSHWMNRRLEDVWLAKE